MQPEPIVLVPPTHEQSTPSFHVEAAIFEDSLAFLKAHEVHITEEPGSLGRPDPHGRTIYEIQVEAGTPLERLESSKRDFQREASR
jgi:hypothetical protein